MRTYNFVSDTFRRVAVSHVREACVRKMSKHVIVSAHTHTHTHVQCGPPRACPYIINVRFSEGRDLPRVPFGTFRKSSSTIGRPQLRLLFPNFRTRTVFGFTRPLRSTLGVYVTRTARYTTFSNRPLSVRVMSR